jgi:hypothetical protein
MPSASIPIYKSAKCERSFHVVYGVRRTEILMIDEVYIYNVAHSRNCESRRDSLLRSYLWTRNCEYVGVSDVQGAEQILFRYRQQVLTLPLESFRTPTWCRTLLTARIDVAEVEYRLTEEKFAREQTLSALKSEIQETEAAAVAVAGQGDA